MNAVRHATRHRREVLIVQLLALGGRSADHRATSQLKSETNRKGKPTGEREAVREIEAFHTRETVVCADHEIGSVEVVFSVDEEEFLLESGVHVHARVLRLAQHAKESHGLTRQCSLRSQQRNLLVQRVRVVPREEARGDVERAAIVVEQHKRRRVRIPCGVAARRVSRPQAAAGERRTVRLAHDQLLAGEANQRSLTIAQTERRGKEKEKRSK